MPATSVAVSLESFKPYQIVRFLCFSLTLTLFFLSRAVLAGNVLFISSAYVAGPFQRAIDQQISEALENHKSPIKLFREDLSSISRKENFVFEEWVTDINKKYAEFEIQRVVFVGGHALNLIGSTYNEVLPGATKYQVSDAKVIQLVSGEAPRTIIEENLLGGATKLIQQLFPKTSQLILISGYPDQLEQMRALEESWPSVKIDLWNASLTYEEILERASKLGDDSIIHYMGMPSDSTTRQRVAVDFLEELAATASRPVFVSYRTSIGRGALGGFVGEPNQTGSVIASLLLNTFTSTTQLLHPTVDYDMLEKWGLSPEELPEGVKTINAPKGYLEDPVRLITFIIYLVVGIVLVTATLSLRTLALRRKAVRAESHAAEIALEQQKSQKLYGVIAHELRTPVSALSMMATASPEEFAASQKDIKRAVDDLLITIEDMSLVVNPNLIRPVREQPFQIDEFTRSLQTRVASMVASAGMTYSADISVSDDFAQQTFLTDIYRVRVAIANFVRNACLHSGGHSVWLRAEVIDEADSHSLLFSVCDDGVGISETEVERLFLEGERGPTQSAGSGLGLYICRTWIEEIGGEVLYAPREGGGSCFSAKIPLKVAGVKAQLPAETSSTEVTEFVENLTVLMVEDELMLRLLGEKLISPLVRSVIVAENGIDALERFDSSVNMVMTDFFMPEMDGAALIRSLRSKGYKGAIIGVTAATIGEQMSQMLDAGADIVLPKPLTKASFMAAAHKLLHRQPVK